MCACRVKKGFRAAWNKSPPLSEVSRVGLADVRVRAMLID